MAKKYFWYSSQVHGRNALPWPLEVRGGHVTCFSQWNVKEQCTLHKFPCSCLYQSWKHRYGASLSKGDRAESLRGPVMDMEHKWEMNLNCFTSLRFCLLLTQKLECSELMSSGSTDRNFYIISLLPASNLWGGKSSSDEHVPVTPSSSGRPHLPTLGERCYLFTQ